MGVRCWVLGVVGGGVDEVLTERREREAEWWNWKVGSNEKRRHAKDRADPTTLRVNRGTRGMPIKPPVRYVPLVVGRFKLKPHHSDGFTPQLGAAPEQSTEHRAPREISPRQPQRPRYPAAIAPTEAATVLTNISRVWEPTSAANMSPGMSLYSVNAIRESFLEVSQCHCDSSLRYSPRSRLTPHQ